MDCAGCGRSNRAGARFCAGCGKPLAPRCPACGAEHDGDAHFCDTCGASLPGRGGEEVVRKVVTIVFADLIGSTALHERLDPESVNRLMDRYYRTVRVPIEEHGGTVVQLLGDGVMCAFGVPRVREDDAIRAVRAAVEMQRAFRDFALAERAMAGEMGLRVAVNTGEVVVSDDHAAGIGDPLNVAARLQQEARDGDVLIGEETQRLVGELVTLAPHGEIALKGRAESVAAFRVVSLERPASGGAIPFVGREDEVRRLTAVYDQAVAAASARLAVVLGSPGLGKSRLLAEIGHRLGQHATVLWAHCDPAGGRTFAPVADAVRGFLGLDDNAGADAVRAAVEAALPGSDGQGVRIADGVAALLAGAPGAPEETFAVVRRLLAALAAARPVVLAIDDLQWAEPLLLDLAEHLVQWNARVPLLVLAAARPELRELRAGLASPGGLVADVVTLGGLDAGAATRLAASVIGAELPAALAGRVLATSEGNPLFVGELVRMLVHDGALRRDGDRWTAGVEIAALEMPPTIHALLAARIERLQAEERMVLERAAVVGRQFSRAAVAHLLPSDVEDLDARLDALRRSELIEPDAGWFLGEPLLRFHHALIRDAAYRRVLKGTRAELHTRFADWLERRIGDAVEHDETIGWHLEQAHQHLRELGPLDAQGRALGERAARFLAAAGRRALGRDDLTRAANQIGRALERLESDDPGRADLVLDWCEALLGAGEVGPAAAAIDELGRLAAIPRPGARGSGFESDPQSPAPRPDAAARGRLRAWHTCFVGQRAVMTDPDALRATADAVAAAAQQLGAAGDAAGEAKAYSVQALALARLGRIGACEAALDQALAAARRGGDRRRASAVLAGAPLAALWGPSPVTRASGRCLDVVRVLRITQGAPAVEAVALRCQAVLEALRGRSDAARRMIETARAMVEELGIPQRLLEVDMFDGLVALLEGDSATAEPALRAAYDGLRAHGLGIDAAQAAALLGRALLGQGRAADAEALTHESERLAGDDLKAAILWRGVRAEAMARRGDAAAAVTLARAAVEIAAATDALLDHADARLALAAALRAAGRDDDAGAEEARAIDLWEAKGATLLADRARRAAGRSAPTAAPAVRSEAGSTVRRIRANAATANAARMDAACAARDEEAFFACLSEDSESIHHPTGTVYAARQSAALRIMFGAEALVFEHQPLATLGHQLALCRSMLSFESVEEAGRGRHGAANVDSVVLLEVDERGLRRRTEFFDLGRLNDAVARLYERYAELLPEGPDRDRAAVTARSVAAVVGPFVMARYATALAPDVEFIDHRVVGFPSGRGADELLRSVGSLVESSDDVVVRIDDVLALREEGFLVRWTTSGTDRLTGGPFEWQFVRFYQFGAAGLVVRAEQFDLDRVDDALQRFEAAGERAAPQISNSATRTQVRFEHRWQQRDWDGITALYAPQVAMTDRRALVGLDLGGEDFVTNTRLMYSLPGSAWQTTLLATRGDRLAMFRVRYSAQGDGGEIVSEQIAINEVGPDGRYVHLTLFDLAALDAAYAELDALYAAGEGAPGADMLDAWQRWRGAAARGDKATIEAMLAEDFSAVSHRRFANLGARLGRDEYVAAMGFPADLGVHFALRLDHVLRLRADAVIGVFTAHGTSTGGAFEQQVLFVATRRDGRLTSLEQFDLDDLDAGLRRWDELSDAVPAYRENLATHVERQTQAAWESRVWERFAALFAPEFRSVDRRSLMHLELDRDTILTSMRPIFDLGPIRRCTILATRGEYLLLLRIALRSDDAFMGASEIEFLQISEVGAHGLRTAAIAFDLGDLEAAYAELDARHAASAAGGGMPAAARAVANAATRAAERIYAAFQARDWARYAALFPPQMRFSDRRAIAQFELDRDQYVAASRQMFVWKSSRVCSETLATRGDRLALIREVWHGDDGAVGPSEVEWIGVNEVDGGGDLIAFVIFDATALDQAYAELDARYEAGEAALDHRDTVTRAFTRAFAARDWSGLAALLAPDLEVHDHRLLGWEPLRGPAPYVAALRELVALAPDVRLRIDHLAMAHPGFLYVTTWLGSRDGGSFEAPSAIVCEIDDGGRIRRFDQYDIDQLDQARAHLARLGETPQS